MGLYSSTVIFFLYLSFITSNYVFLTMVDLFTEPFKSFYYEPTCNLETQIVYMLQILFFFFFYVYITLRLRKPNFLHSLFQFCKIFLQTFGITSGFDCWE